MGRNRKYPPSHYDPQYSINIGRRAFIFGIRVDEWSVVTMMGHDPLTTNVGHLLGERPLFLMMSYPDRHVEPILNGKIFLGVSNYVRGKYILFKLEWRQLGLPVKKKLKFFEAIIGVSQPSEN